MVRLEGVSKVYRKQSEIVKALDNITKSFPEGEFTVVKSPSGSGKTTLLMMIAGMLKPTTGQVIVDGRDIYAMGGLERAEFRAANVGFIFQMFHLLPYLNVHDNILLAGSGEKARQRADQLLAEFGLAGRINHRPAELSAGEKQRTATARALLNEPRLILADEPTGNLDKDNAAEVIKHLSAFRQNGGTVLMVTHQDVADDFADSVVHLIEGRIVES